VLLGVLGEGFEILSKKYFKHWYEKHESAVETFGVICWVIVMIGLALEIPDAAKTDKDAEELRKQAGVAEQKSNEAEVLAGLIGTTNAHLVADNLVLRSNVVELELKLQPRTITIWQITNFIFLTERIPKFPIRVVTGLPNDETFSYAIQIKAMLNQAGYATPDSDTNYLQGVYSDPTAITFQKIGETNEWADLEICSPSTNEIVSETIMGEKINGFQRPIIFSLDDTDGIAKAFIRIFNQIGIKTGYVPAPAWISPNHLGVYIRQKAQ
jgi:hypothetical protein